MHLATTDGVHTVTLLIEPSGPGVHLLATVDDPGTDPDSAINRVSLGWKMHDDGAGPPGDHFLGLGERFYLTDHRGQPKTYVWVEDKGLGQGEDASPGPANPLPNGPDDDVHPDAVVHVAARLRRPAVDDLPHGLPSR